MFLKHFAGKNQLPGLSVSGTLIKNGLNCSFVFSSTVEMLVQSQWNIHSNKINFNLIVPKIVNIANKLMSYIFSARLIDVPTT